MLVSGGASMPARGVASSAPATRWENGFLTGNGRMAAIVFGQPANETIVLNHERLFLPTTKQGGVLPDLAKYLPELRRIMREEAGKLEAADKAKGTRSLPRARMDHMAAGSFIQAKAKEEGLIPSPVAPYHPGFELKIDMPAGNEAGDCRRTTDFESGEVAVCWGNGKDNYVRRLFVSRPDNVIVLSIQGPRPSAVSCELYVPPIRNAAVKSVQTSDREWITIGTEYLFGKGGYDVAIRIVPKGGKVQSNDGRVSIRDADEVLVLMKIEPYTETQQHCGEALKDALRQLPADYNALLQPHAKEHGELFHRVALDLGGTAEERAFTSEALLARAKAGGYKNVPPALLEKMYDAGRFYFIASAGELPPNLQGKWNGDWKPAWASDYHLDINLEVAMDSALSANMAEGMEGFFDLVESWLPDWRGNAQKLYGARGVMSPICSTTHGVNYCRFQFWTAGAGWLASYFYDYYLFTGDREFLARRAVPLMREVALFYEDFLFEDASGKYRFSPSFSPESGTRDNSTMDIAVATEVLKNLIAACRQLGIEAENIPKWQAMLEKMPAYQIGPDGDLAEWADGSRVHHYLHRHHSPFYPVFRSFEFSPERTPDLWKAVTVSFEKKDAAMRESRDWPGIPFARAMHAQSAAYLGRGDIVEEMVNRMADRVYPSLHMSCKPETPQDAGIFSFDGNGAYPDLINRSLAFSLEGTLDLLRAVPPGWTKGSISGILVRGQIKIDRLQWDQNKGEIHLELTSAISQEITLRLPASAAISSLKVVKGAARAETSPQGPNARRVPLPAQETVTIELRCDGKPQSSAANAR